MLNLLPPQEKKLLMQNRQKRLLIVLIIELLVFLICVLLVVLSVEFYIFAEMGSQTFLLEQAMQESQSPDFLKYKDIIVKYNQRINSVNSFYNNQKSAGAGLEALLAVQRPEGLYFKNFSMQMDQSNIIKLVLSGTSDTRENLIAFKKNIEENKKMRNVSFSSESWIEQKNVNFNLTLDLVI